MCDDEGPATGFAFLSSAALELARTVQAQLASHASSIAAAKADAAENAGAEGGENAQGQAHEQDPAELQQQQQLLHEADERRREQQQRHDCQQQLQEQEQQQQASVSAKRSAAAGGGKRSVSKGKKTDKLISQWAAKSRELAGETTFVDPKEAPDRKRVKGSKGAEARQVRAVVAAAGAPDLVTLTVGLPLGWRAMYDEASKRVYYGNPASGETSWTRPA